MVHLLTLLACSLGSAPTDAPSNASSPASAAKGGAPSKRPDVVFITLDTMRVDHIGAYGYEGAKTETIDRLAKEGLRFDWAFSPLPLTIPAHSTMFTGYLPYHHNIRSNGDNVLSTDFVTLAERMRGAGYATAASVSAFVTTRQWGFSQGFDAYYDSMPEGSGDKNYWHTERTGEEVVNDALSWLSTQNTEKPVFLWAHFYDAHFPYKLHPGDEERFAGRPYDSEIAYVDDQIERLVKAFEGRDVVWVLIGDHGEGLGEHDENTHGLYSYNATQHVPWIISGAGVSPQVVKEPVSTADVSPTLLKILGMEVPTDIDGKPQPGAGGQPYAESYQLSERFRLAPHRMIVDGNYKLIDLPKPELYDIIADPKELKNLAAEKPEEVARLQKLLADRGAKPPSKGSSEMDADTLAQLAALGYVSGGGGEDVDYATLPDPKDYAEFLRRLNNLENAKNGPAAALAELQELAEMKPDAFEVWMRQIPLLARSGQAAKARDVAQEMAKQFPERSRVWVTLSGMALRDGSSAEALEYARTAMERDPADSAAQEALVNALVAVGKIEEAVKEGEKFMEVNPKSYGVAAVLGQYYLSKKDFVQAEKNLRVAVAGPNPKRGARVQLAALALAAKARPDAYTLLEAEVKDYPGNLAARRMLSRMLAEDNRFLDQKPHVEFISRRLPQDTMAQLALAQCYFNLKDYRSARAIVDLAMILDPDSPDVLLLHANLLAKEGKKEEGYQVFQKAEAMNKARVEEAKKRAPKDVSKTDKPAEKPAEKPPEKSQPPAGGK